MMPGETILSARSLGMPNNPHNGEFKVMQSAGSKLWYIGTMFLSCGDPNCKECREYNFASPRRKGEEIDYNSRETDYMETRKEAEDALAIFKATGDLPGQR